MVDYENQDVLLTVCIAALCIFTDAETNVCPAVVDVQRSRVGWAEENSENSGRENLLDQDGIMDFSVVAIAEELTQIDSVSNDLCSRFMRFYCYCNTDAQRLIIIFHGVSGSVCQSGPLPVSRLCMVTEGQKGKHVPHYSSHHRTVQHYYQPGHRVTALPAHRYILQSHLNLPASYDTNPTSPHH